MTDTCSAADPKNPIPCDDPSAVSRDLDEALWDGRGIHFTDNGPVPGGNNRS